MLFFYDKNQPVLIALPPFYTEKKQKNNFHAPEI
jgi:hypothetical protein